MDESSIELKWSAQAISRSLSLDLIRYRVFFSTDNFNNDNNEWPVQIERLSVAEARAVSNRTRLFAIIQLANTYDCFNECIRNSLCSFAVHLKSSTSNQFECHLKSSQEGLSSLEEIEYATSIEANNHIRVAGYKSEAIVKNLPPNHAYSFRVSVYDQLSETWSEISDSFAKPVDTSLSVLIEHKKLDNGVVLIKWKQQPGNNYPLSRCTIRVQSNDDVDVLREHNQMNNLIKRNFFQSFFFDYLAIPKSI